MISRMKFLQFGKRFISSSIQINLPKCEVHRLDNTLLPKESHTNKEELLHFYRQMNLVRKTEIASDLAYKNKEIRGFCHLCDGQEAICVGMEAGITKDDHLITAYRCHGKQLCRGDTPLRIIGEMMGKQIGCSKGKGGSMHLTLSKNKFYGGNGIVGAQVPIGAGIAFGIKYSQKKEVCITMYGDGAANQGQIFEAANMAMLWKLPCIFVCENNRYAMGTSNERSASNTNYFQRLDLIPGIKVDGQNIFMVKEIMKFARKWCLDDKGPMCIEFNTYRYHGHSMSDPGLTYRSREEVQEVRKSRDPIDYVKSTLLDNGLCQEKDLKEIEREVKQIVDKAFEEAKSAPITDLKELFTDVIVGPGRIRGVEIEQMYEQN